MKSTVRTILDRSFLALPPLLLAGAASAQAQLPAWLILPAWQEAVEAVKAGQGKGAVAYEPKPGSQLAGFDYLLSTPTQIDTLAIGREFYFDVERKLALVRIVPARTDTANCDALLAATIQAIGKQDEQPTTISLMDTRYWFRRKEDRLYGWFQIKSFRGPSPNTPCGLSIEPYKAGMTRKKK
jgi:hypothetical protein